MATRKGYRGTQRGNPYLDEAGNLHEGDLMEVADAQQHTPWYVHAAKAGKYLAPSVGVAYLDQILNPALNSVMANAAAPGTAAAGATAPSLPVSANLPSWMLPSSGAATGGAASGAAAGTGSAAAGVAADQVKKGATNLPPSNESGPSLKKLLTLLGVQAGVGTLGGLLDSGAGERQSFADYTGPKQAFVNPIDTLATANEGALQLGSAIGQSMQQPKRRLPSASVAGVPFEIGGMGGEGTDPGVADFLSWLNQKKAGR